MSGETRPLSIVDLAGSPVDERRKAASYFLSHIRDMDSTLLLEVAKQVLKELTDRGMGEPGLEAVA